MLAPIGAVDLGGYDDLHPACGEDIDDTLLRIIGTIGKQRCEPSHDLGQQGVGAMQVVQMAGRQVKGDRIAQRIAQGVQLGAQPAFAAADLLACTSAPFAPALD